MISFVLFILSFSHMSHILPHAAVFRCICFSFASYCVSVFESRLFCSPLTLVIRSCCLLLNNYLINSWPKLGFGIGRILEIIQPVSLYLPTYHHWDLQSLNAVPKVIQLGWSLTFFLELILEHLSLSVLLAKDYSIRHCPGIGTNPENPGKPTYVVGPQSLGLLRQFWTVMFTPHPNIEHFPNMLYWLPSLGLCPYSLFTRTVFLDHCLWVFCTPRG